MEPHTYRYVTEVAESEIRANSQLAARATGERERYGFERQAVGAFQLWQQITRGTKTREDEARLAGYMSGPPMPPPGV